MRGVRRGVQEHHRQAGVPLLQLGNPREGPPHWEGAVHSGRRTPVRARLHRQELHLARGDGRPGSGPPLRDAGVRGGAPRSHRAP